MSGWEGGAFSNEDTVTSKTYAALRTCKALFYTHSFSTALEWGAVLSAFTDEETGAEAAEKQSSEAWLGRLTLLSHVWLFTTPWTVTRQAPRSMEFSRHEYWSGLPFPPPGNLPWPRDWTCVSCTAGGFFTIWATRDVWLNASSLSLCFIFSQITQLW